MVSVVEAGGPGSDRASQAHAFADAISTPPPSAIDHLDVVRLCIRDVDACRYPGDRGAEIARSTWC